MPSKQYGGNGNDLICYIFADSDSEAEFEGFDQGHFDQGDVVHQDNVDPRNFYNACVYIISIQKKNSVVSVQAKKIIWWSAHGSSVVRGGSTHSRFSGLLCYYYYS